MADMSQRRPPVPVSAATILLLRDSDSGIEVFMVKRHQEIEFAGGALVFPGGKADRSDGNPEFAGLADGLEIIADLRVLAIAALREAFEEAGILIARDAGGAFVSDANCDRLQPQRELVENGTLTFAEMLRRERLRLACDQLVPFARWITPKSMPRRFDTQFFVARVPPGQHGRHCGRESVDSLWVHPRKAACADGRLLFPTRMNLLKLAAAQSVEETLAAARAAPCVTVEPWTEETPEGTFVRIPSDAGYARTRIPLSETLP